MRNVVLEGEEMMHLLLETHQQKANTCQFHLHNRAAAAEGRGSLLLSIPLAYVGMFHGSLLVSIGRGNLLVSIGHM